MFFSNDEVEKIYRLAEKITGSFQRGQFRSENIIRNVERRMIEKKIKNLKLYLELIEKDSIELKHFISDITIHTTSWFREKPHFDLVKKYVEEFIEQNLNKQVTLKVWSVACSTGEEVFSAALTLNEINQRNKNIDFVVHGSDIDELCVQKSKKAIYSSAVLNQIPSMYQSSILLGHKKLSGFFTLDLSIRSKCNFFVHNIISENYKLKFDKYDIIFCRNVLIYFSKDSQEKIIKSLVKHLNPNGLLLLGHSDSFSKNPDLVPLGNACFKYQKILEINQTVDYVQKLRPQVLIIDDSNIIRTKISKILKSTCDIYYAASTKEANQVLASEKITFITLDLNMPEENGASWLSRMRNLNMKIPTVIISDSKPEDAELVFGALSAGAQDYIVKSKLHEEPKLLVSLVKELNFKSEKTSFEKYQLANFDRPDFDPKFIVVGASTGGPQTIAKLFKNLPHNFLPLIIVQHISHEYSTALLNRICKESGLKQGFINDNKPLVAGHVYMAMDDYHLQIKTKNSELYIQKSFDDKLHGHRPSVDILFNSISILNIDCLALLLTGMGKDGAEGLLKMVKNKNTFSLVQDESSSIVFGMPKKAIETGAACFVGNIEELRNKLDTLTKINISEQRNAA